MIYEIQFLETFFCEDTKDIITSLMTKIKRGIYQEEEYTRITGCFHFCICLHVKFNLQSFFIYFFRCLSLKYQQIVTFWTRHFVKNLTPFLRSLYLFYLYRVWYLMIFINNTYSFEYSYWICNLTNLNVSSRSPYLIGLKKNEHELFG